jgi:hypothetical protein
MGEKGFSWATRKSISAPSLAWRSLQRWWAFLDGLEWGVSGEVVVIRREDPLMEMDEGF